METIVAPVSIEKSPEARGRSGLLTYEHKKIDLLVKEAIYIYTTYFFGNVNNLI